MTSTKELLFLHTRWRYLQAGWYSIKKYEKSTIKESTIPAPNLDNQLVLFFPLAMYG